MSKSQRDLQAALSQIEENWDDQRAQRGLEQAQRKLQGRGRRKLLATGAVAASCLAVVGLVALRWTPTEPTISQPLAVGGEPAQTMQLPDGSRIWLLSPETRVVMREVSAQRIGVELATGRARFEVVRDENRVFQVHSGHVMVQVLGTVFEVERAAERTRVGVTRGKVAVHWDDERSELTAGEAGWFPRLDGSDAALERPRSGVGTTVDDASSAGEPKVMVSREANPPTSKRETRRHGPSGDQAKARGTQAGWREVAERGEFAQAYELLRKTPQPPADDVEELLLAADAARLSGHPEAALRYLERVVNDHARDSRAPVAAFTLGGVLMQQLDRAHDAEVAYGKARALSLHSSLAQDALARQVEAAHRAGDAARARSLATEYLEQFPNGRRVNAVRRFGGLSDD
jgi:transmembrane sensor